MDFVLIRGKQTLCFRYRGSHVKGGPKNIYSFDLKGEKVASKIQNCLRNVQMVYSMDSELIMKIEFGLRLLLVSIVITHLAFL